jgi:hypothetical protein
VIRIGPTAGTGTPTRDYDVGATDLCEFMEFTSGILQVCGDSFAGQGVGFGPWHSPIALHVESESIDDQSGVRYDRVTGNDKPLLADPTPAATSRRGRRLTSCGCSSASGTPVLATTRRTASSSSR